MKLERASILGAARTALTHWRLKALVQKALSSLPGGRQANYVLQRRITHGIPITEARLVESVESARAHLEAFRRHASPPTPVAEALFYEFGAGWDLHLPLTLYGLGVRRQVVVDLTPHARGDLFDDVVARLSVAPGLPEGARREVDAVAADAARCSDVAAKASCFGISYRAPADARATGLAESSVDCVTSTSTLEHVPEQDIGPILAECLRILRRGGVGSFLVDYSDHYSHLDRSITPYNFLRYSERRWRLYNSPLQFQNRLRHSQYLAMIEAAGFEVLEAVPTVDEAGRRTLRTVPLGQTFGEFAEDDLATTAGRIVVRKPS